MVTPGSYQPVAELSVATRNTLAQGGRTHRLRRDRLLNISLLISALWCGRVWNFDVLSENAVGFGHPNRLDPKPLKNVYEIGEATFPIGYPGRTPAAPKSPPEPLKNPLSPSIVGPSVRAVVLVAIQLDC